MPSINLVKAVCIHNIGQTSVVDGTHAWCLYASGLKIGYEPVDLTVHPPPEPPRVGSFFLYMCLMFPENVLKGKPALPELLGLKDLKTCFFITCIFTQTKF